MSCLGAGISSRHTEFGRGAVFHFTWAGFAIWCKNRLLLGVFESIFLGFQAICISWFLALANLATQISGFHEHRKPSFPFQWWSDFIWKVRGFFITGRKVFDKIVRLSPNAPVQNYKLSRAGLHEVKGKVHVTEVTCLLNWVQNQITASCFLLRCSFVKFRKGPPPAHACLKTFWNESMISVNLVLQSNHFRISQKKFIPSDINGLF